MEIKKMEPTTSKTWFIVLFLFIFWPVGIFFMWKHDKWNIATRVVLSIMALILAFTISAAAIYTTIRIVDDSTSATKEGGEIGEIGNIEEEAPLVTDDPVVGRTLDEAIWSLETPYIFAVNITYDGDVFAPGQYEFDLSSDSETIAYWNSLNQAIRTYDIYVSTTLYSSAKSVKAKELKATVGGANDSKSIISLKTGDYVYVIPTEMSGSPKGSLEIDRVD